MMMMMMMILDQRLIVTDVILCNEKGVAEKKGGKLRVLRSQCYLAREVLLYVELLAGNNVFGPPLLGTYRAAPGTT